MKKLISLMVLFLFLLLRATPAYAVELIMGPDLIYKPTTSMVTVNDILDLYTSYGKVITVDLDGYTGNGATPGTYEISLVANDGINDVATKNIQVTVVESNVSPKIKVVTDTGNIYVSNAVPITHQEIINSLASIGLIHYDKTTTSAYLLKDDYTQNSEMPGYYQFQFRLIDLSGLDNTYQILIYVSDSNQLIHQPINMGSNSNFIDDFGGWIILGIVGVVLYNFFKNKKGSGTRTIKPY